MPLIARVMDQAGIEFGNLDRIAVTTGPGSFTGLRVGISAARGIALAAGKPAVGLSTLAGFAAPHIAENDNTTVVAAIDARHEHVYLQVFGPGGKTVVPPRIAPLHEAVRAAMTGPARIVGSGAELIAAQWPKAEPPPDAGRATGRSRHRLDRAARRRRRRRSWAAEAALSARARRAAAGRRATATPMIGLLTRLFSRSEPVLSEATPRDAAAIAKLHAASFNRGWSEDEIDRLLHRAQRAHASRRRERPAGRIHHVAHRRRRGRNPVGRGFRVIPRQGAGAADAQSPHGTAVGDRARASSSSKWVKAMPQPVRSIGAPASPRPAAAKATTLPQTASGRRHWCCAAT